MNLNNNNILLFLCFFLLVAQIATLTIEEYVSDDDTSYSYEFLFSSKLRGIDIHVLKMTSQTWMSIDYSDSPLWTHNIIICAPHGKQKIKYDTGLLLISGNIDMITNKTELYEESKLDYMVDTARRLQSSVSMITRITIPKIIFKNDPEQKARSYDDQIGYSWSNYILNSNLSEESIIMYPMCKAVVRAMDAINNYTSTLYPKGHTEKFIINGESKRGWIVWLVSAFDTRVAAQVPMLMTLLNGKKLMLDYYRSLGGWSFALYNYWSLGVLNDFNNQRFNELMSFIDPYMSIEKYTMPTYVIATTGDQFFLPDSTRYFYNQLPGRKYLTIIPNVGHYMTPDAYELLAVFSKSFLKETKRPKMMWNLYQIKDKGKIDLFIKTKLERILEVCSWSALSRTTDTRDFRSHYYNNGIRESGVKWIKQCHNITNLRKTYTKYDVPSDGWLAFFVEAKFVLEDGSNLSLTTDVNIIPSSYPIPRCTGKDGCKTYMLY